jgi:hypothetical protein
MDPPELASEPASCYARRGRIEPPQKDFLEWCHADFYLHILYLIWWLEGNIMM